MYIQELLDALNKLMTDNQAKLTELGIYNKMTQISEELSSDVLVKSLANPIILKRYQEFVNIVNQLVKEG